MEEVVDNIKDFQELKNICRKRTVLDDKELNEYWEKFPKYRPFVINFLYAFSFKKRINLKTMLDEKILPGMDSVKTINKIERNAFLNLIKLAGI